MTFTMCPPKSNTPYNRLMISFQSTSIKRPKSFVKTGGHSPAITVKPGKHFYLHAAISLRTRLEPETALSLVSSTSCYGKALYALALSMR